MSIAIPLRQWSRLRIPSNHLQHIQRSFSSTPSLKAARSPRAARSPNARRAEQASKRAEAPKEDNARRSNTPYPPSQYINDEGDWCVPALGDLKKRLALLERNGAIAHNELATIGGLVIGYGKFMRIGRRILYTAYTEAPSAQFIEQLAESEGFDVNGIYKIAIGVCMHEPTLRQWILSSCSLAGSSLALICDGATHINACRTTQGGLRSNALVRRVEKAAEQGDPRLVQLKAEILALRGEYREAFRLMKAVIASIYPSPRGSPMTIDQIFIIHPNMRTPWEVYHGLADKVDGVPEDELVNVMLEGAYLFQDPQALQDLGALMLGKEGFEVYEECLSIAASSGDATACLKLANFYYLTYRGWFPRRGVKVSGSDSSNAKPWASKPADAGKPVEERKPGILASFFSFLFTDVKSPAQYRMLALEWYELAFSHGSNRAALLLSLLLREDGHFEKAWELFGCSHVTDVQSFAVDYKEIKDRWSDQSFQVEVPHHFFDL